MGSVLGVRLAARPLYDPYDPVSQYTKSISRRCDGSHRMRKQAATKLPAPASTPTQIGPRTPKPTVRPMPTRMPRTASRMPFRPRLTLNSTTTADELDRGQRLLVNDRLTLFEFRHGPSVARPLDDFPA
jgi:hypothetical protein